MAVPPVVALEIGTTKTVALVGEMREDGHIMITGIGHRPSTGVRKGAVMDLENAAVGVRAALTTAEESGKVAIRRVHLAASGGHIQSLVNRGAVPVLDKEGEITQRDIEQVMEVARAVNLGQDRETIHTVCQHFIIDEQERVIQPEGMEGARLSLDMLVIHGLRSRLHNTIKVVKNLPMDVEDVAFSGLCSALSVLTPEQKKNGVVVVDLGGGTTDYLAYAGTVMATAGCLAVGGDHITNDVALAFNIPTSQAEKLKCDAGSALIESAEPGRKVTLQPEGGFPGRTIPLQSLHTVIHARVEETLQMVRRQLEEAGVLRRLAAGVVLTGGGAYLNGITKLAERVFGVSCSIGRPRNVSGLTTATEGAEYAACSGLVQYAFKTYGGRLQHASPFGQWLMGLIGR